MEGVVNDAVGVLGTGRSETACFWGSWGKQSGWSTSRVCCNASGSVHVRSRAMVRGAEQGRARGNTVVIDVCVDDMAARVDM